MFGARFSAPQAVSIRQTLPMTQTASSSTRLARVYPGLERVPLQRDQFGATAMCMNFTGDTTPCRMLNCEVSPRLVLNHGVRRRSEVAGR